MGVPRFTWTPKGEGSVSFVGISTGGIERLPGFVNADTRVSVSRGGQAISVTYDPHMTYEVRIEAISRVDDHQIWHGLAAFAAHAKMGGEFAFRLDIDKDSETTLNGAITKGDTDPTLTSTTGISAGDTLFVEDVDDPTKVDYWRVTTVGAPMTLTYGSRFSFGDASPVRHADFFPKCVVTDARRVRWEERPGGSGPYLWDLRLGFRTVR